MEAQQQTRVSNPYWDEVKDDMEPALWGSGYMVGNLIRRDANGQFRSYEDSLYNRHDLVGKYSWTIPDPATLTFVHTHSGGRMVDPLAGTGYWAYLLGQLGVDVVCYDLNPGDNTWQDDGVLYTEVTQMDGADSAALHPDRTLLLAWPPYNQDVGYRVLRAYQGERVIFIGEPESGCTGDDQMHELLHKEWGAVATHRPVQWFGLHDEVTVYDRRSGGGCKCGHRP